MAQARTIGPGSMYSPTTPPPQVGGLPGATNIIGEMSMLIPGLRPATNTAMANIQNLLQGIESPAITQNMNAVWGAGSGMAPGSEFLRNRAVDLYGQRGEARQQQGLQGLLGLLSGMSAPYTNIRGQNITQRGQDITSMLEAMNLGQRANESSANNSLEQDRLTLQALGLLANQI